MKQKYELICVVARIGIYVDDEKVYIDRVCCKSVGKTSSGFLKDRWTKIILALIIIDVAEKGKYVSFGAKHICAY